MMRLAHLIARRVVWAIVLVVMVPVAVVFYVALYLTVVLHALAIGLRRVSGVAGPEFEVASTRRPRC